MICNVALLQFAPSQPKPKESRLDYLYPSFFDFLEMKSKNTARKTGAKTRKKAQILISALSNF